MSSAPTRIALREVDVFTDVRARAAALGNKNRTRTTADPYIRRPLRGIQFKKDTFATIVVLLPDGRTLDLVNSSAPVMEGETQGRADHTANFLLTGVQQEKSEKFQPLLTFGPTWGFFFGEHPHLYNFTAILLNTQNFSWELEWWENYDNLLRGTALTEHRARVFLSFDDYVVEGYLVNARTGRSADDPHVVQLSFSMWVTASETLRKAGDTRAGGLDDGAPADVPDSFDLTEDSLNILRANVAAVQAGTDSGFGLFNTIRKIGEAIENAGDAIRSFLLQENLVVPEGGEGILRGPTGPVFSWKVPTAYDRPQTTYFDNKDEYLGGHYWKNDAERHEELILRMERLQLPSGTHTAAQYTKLEVAIPPSLIAQYRSSSSDALAKFLGKAAFAILAVGPALATEALDATANEEKQKAQRAREDVLLGNLSDQEAAERLSTQQAAETRARDYAAASSTTKTLQSLAEELS